MNAVKVPHDQLSLQALRGVIEEFVTRDGTDYGVAEVSLETKVSQVLALLKSGRAALVFDPDTETCNILRSTDPAVKRLDG